MRSKSLFTAACIAAACVLAILATKSAQAQTYKVLYAFGSNGGGDGAGPEGVIQDSEGNLYGATVEGGIGSACLAANLGCGTVFKLSKKGKETVLYSFTGGADGANPQAGLIQDDRGNLYGTTYQGGSCGGSGCGVVFRLSKTGKETVLYSFTGGPDGAYPEAGLIQDPRGNLYGTTSKGGYSNNGTVFRLSKTGKEIALYSFGEFANPSGLIQDAKGNLYGTTYYGGTTGCGLGCGVVFRQNKTGHQTLLHAFAGGTDGGNPPGGVIRDAKGNLYGTTSCGDAENCYGTVFKLSKAGKETVLYTFTGGVDGKFPSAGVIQGPQGNLYGTTSEGGDLFCDEGSGCGAVFKLTP
jgi:uncharacterized repeat protein (TIGR03803 family)